MKGKIQTRDYFMPKKKTQNKSYPITISDWIVFLESNAQTNTNLFIFLSTALIVIMVAFVGFKTTDISEFTLMTVLTLIIGSIFVMGLIYASNRAKPYQRLSRKVILGEITDPKEIREEYKKFMKKI